MPLSRATCPCGKEFTKSFEGEKYCCNAHARQYGEKTLHPAKRLPDPRYTPLIERVKTTLERQRRNRNLRSLKRDKNFTPDQRTQLTKDLREAADAMERGQ